MRRKLVLVATIALVGVGCATAGRINNIRVGMERETVFLELGEPDQDTENGNSEVLQYNFSETNFDAQHGIRVPYLVFLRDDHVTKFGRAKVNEELLSAQRYQAWAIEAQSIAQQNAAAEQRAQSYNTNSQALGNRTPANTFQATQSSFAMSCGLKPLAQLGCHIGQCVNGQWQQICDSSPTLTCGLKPLPNLNCHIGRCIGGTWEQVCDSAPTLTCGLKPLPNLGCHVGNCVNGAWEQVCN